MVLPFRAVAAVAGALRVILPCRVGQFGDGDVPGAEPLNSHQIPPRPFARDHLSRATCNLSRWGTVCAAFANSPAVAHRVLSAAVATSRGTGTGTGTGGGMGTGNGRPVIAVQSAAKPARSTPAWNSFRPRCSGQITAQHSSTALPQNLSVKLVSAAQVMNFSSPPSGPVSARV